MTLQQAQQRASYNALSYGGVWQVTTYKKQLWIHLIGLGTHIPPRARVRFTTET